MHSKPHFSKQAAILATMLLSAVFTGAVSPALAQDHPNGIAVDVAGNVYVADSGDVEQGRKGDISIYSVAVKSGVLTAKLKGQITTNINNPYSVAVSPFGTIYAGNLDKTITVYSPSLTQTGTITDGSIITYAADMFVDGDGDLWALDGGGNVHAYLDNLTPVSTFSVGGIATAITPWGSNVAVWGRNASGISTLTANMGEGVHGNPVINGNYSNGSMVPTGVAEDSLHQQYVTNSTVGTITVISADFTHVVRTFNAYGSAIAIDPIRQRIYTTVPSSSAVFVYALQAPNKYLGQF